MPLTEATRSGTLPHEAFKGRAKLEGFEVILDTDLEENNQEKD